VPFFYDPIELLTPGVSAPTPPGWRPVVSLNLNTLDPGVPGYKSELWDKY
jgi:hypothetical protein